MAYSNLNIIQRLIVSAAFSRCPRSRWPLTFGPMTQTSVHSQKSEVTLAWVLLCSKLPCTLRRLYKDPATVTIQKHFSLIWKKGRAKERHFWSAQKGSDAIDLQIVLLFCNVTVNLSNFHVNLYSAGEREKKKNRSPDVSLYKADMDIK